MGVACIDVLGERSGTERAPAETSPPVPMVGPGVREHVRVSIASFARDVDARLEAAAESGDALELIVVLRGTVHRGHPGTPWRVRLPDGHYRVVSSESVVAATRIKK